MNSQKTHYYPLILYILFASYFFFLGAYPLLIADEARYVEVAREMVAAHQYIIPHLNGIYFFDKPILYYWLQAFAMHIFGQREWAVRIVPALFACLGIGGVFYTLKRLYDSRAAISAAMILSSCPLYFFIGHYANLDMQLAVLITLGLSSFLIAYQPQNQSFHAGWLYSAYTFAGLAILTKGLIGIVFPIMIIGLWILFSNQWYLLKNMRIFSGLLLCAIICMPWFIIIEKKAPGFSYYYFYIQQYLRFSTPGFNNLQPWWFYVPRIMVGVFPWIIIMAWSIYKAIRSDDKIQLFLMIWVVSILLFFSVPHSKMLGYILPIFPPLAMLAAIHIASLPTKWLSSTILLMAFLFLVSGAALPFFWMRYGQLIGITPTLFHIVMVSCLAIALFLLIIQCYVKKYQLIAITMACLLSFNFAIGVFSHFHPPVENEWFAIKPLIQNLQPLLKPQDKIMSFRDYFYDLPFYAQRPIFIVQIWNSANLAQKDSWRGEFAYARQHLQPSAQRWMANDADLVAIWNSKQRVFLFIKQKKLPQLSALLKDNPLCEVAIRGKILVVSNDTSLCIKLKSPLIPPDV